MAARSTLRDRIHADRLARREELSHRGGGVLPPTPLARVRRGFVDAAVVLAPFLLLFVPAVVVAELFAFAQPDGPGDDIVDLPLPEIYACVAWAQAASPCGEAVPV